MNVREKVENSNRIFTKWSFISHVLFMSNISQLIRIMQRMQKSIARCGADKELTQTMHSFDAFTISSSADKIPFDALRRKGETLQTIDMCQFELRENGEMAQK